MKKINVLPQTFYQFECDKDLIVKILPLVEKENYVRTDQNLNLYLLINEIYLGNHQLKLY